MGRTKINTVTQWPEGLRERVDIAGRLTNELIAALGMLYSEEEITLRMDRFTEAGFASDRAREIACCVLRENVRRPAARLKGPVYVPPKKIQN